MVTVPMAEVEGAESPTPEANRAITHKLSDNRARLTALIHKLPKGSDPQCSHHPETLQPKMVARMCL